MKHRGIDFDEDVLARRKPPTAEQLRYLAFEIVKEWHQIREECEAEIVHHQDYGLLADVAKYRELLQEITDKEADMLGAAQWARCQLKERGLIE